MNQKTTPLLLCFPCSLAMSGSFPFFMGFCNFHVLKAQRNFRSWNQKVKFSLHQKKGVWYLRMRVIGIAIGNGWINKQKIKLPLGGTCLIPTHCQN